MSRSQNASFLMNFELDFSLLFLLQLSPTMLFLIFCQIFGIHSLIREVLIQSCSAGAKNFTNYVFCHPQFSGVIQNIENRCAIFPFTKNISNLLYYICGKFYHISKFGAGCLELGRWLI